MFREQIRLIGINESFCGFREHVLQLLEERIIDGFPQRVLVLDPVPAPDHEVIQAVGVLQGREHLVRVAVQRLCERILDIADSVDRCLRLDVALGTQSLVQVIVCLLDHDVDGINEAVNLRLQTRQNDLLHPVPPF